MTDAPTALSALSALSGSSILPADGQADASFRAWYAEVEALLQALPARIDGGQGDRFDDRPDDRVASTAHEAARQAQRRLRTLIDLQDLQAQQAGGPLSTAERDQHRYLKAALADELLLTRPWAGQSAWPQHLLETALFGTSVAGDKLLNDIAQLLQTREPAQRPLARLQLFALALGFQGRLRGQDDLRALASLRLQLYQFVYQRQPVPEAAQGMLSAQAYAHTVSHLAPKRRRSLNRWALHWALSLLLLLVLSQALWFWQTWPLRQALTGTGTGLPAASAGAGSEGPR